MAILKSKQSIAAALFLAGLGIGIFVTTTSAMGNPLKILGALVGTTAVGLIIKKGGEVLEQAQ